jgi:dihydropteroate synthase
MTTWHLSDRELTIGRPLIMGIVNVTPDSFSDGGKFATTESAVAHGRELIAQGADLLDIGGESTRPGSLPVTLEEELRRVVPVVEALAGSAIPLSVDTSKADVARQCLARGASIINDVSALTGDSAMLGAVRDAQAAVILMHMQGTPATMQLEPRYDDVVGDVIAYLKARIAALAEAGIASDRLAVDPGIGFGKTRDHNIEILARLAEFKALGRPVCLGVSRKGFMGRLLDRPVDQRLSASLAVACHAMSQDAVQILRVHDVRETRDAVTMWQALAQPRRLAEQSSGTP